MAAISVQEDGGGDYTTLEAAVENASTGDGDVITITETWTSSENTQIAVTDALTIQATGASKHIGRPHNGSETTFRHRNSSSGHSFTITDTGSVTFIGLDIQNASTGTSDEVFRNNVANTFLAQNCVLGFASRTSEQDVFYTETTTNATFEQCHFYNVFRGCLDLTGSASGTVNINSCTAYDIGFSDSQTSRSGLVGKNTSGTMTVNIYNTIVHMNEVGFPVCTNSTAANTTANIERLITNSSQAPMDNAPATANYANNVVTATINDTDSSGNYILLDTTTSPYDLRLFDNDTNNAAQDNHSTATGANLTIPSTDIVGTSRPQNTNFDIGAFEVEVGGGVTVNLTGQLSTFSQGALTVTGAASVELTGQSATFSQGAITVDISAAVTVNLTGQAATFSQGSLAVTGEALVSLSGQQITANQGTIAVSVGGAVNVILSGQQIASSQGAITATGEALVSIAGQEMTSGQGTVTVSIVTTPTVINLSGQAIALNIGIIGLQTANVISLTGQAITLTQGSLTVTGDLPSVPDADGLTVSGNFGVGISITSSFGTGATVKGKL